MTAASDASGRAPAEDCEVERRLHRQQQNAGVQIGGFVRGIRAVDLQHAMQAAVQGQDDDAVMPQPPGQGLMPSALNQAGQRAQQQGHQKHQQHGQGIDAMAEILIDQREQRAEAGEPQIDPDRIFFLSRCRQCR